MLSHDGKLPIAIRPSPGSYPKISDRTLTTDRPPIGKGQEAGSGGIRGIPDTPEPDIDFSFGGMVPVPDS
jgi:hypothetical protein